MNKLLFLLLTLFSFSAHSLEIVSEHNEEHVAIKEAQKLLAEAGCNAAYPVRQERFRVVKEGENIRVLAKEFLLECARDLSPQKANLMQCEIATTGNRVEITWSAPTQREDGSTLQESEISYYWVYLGSSEGDLTRLDKSESLSFTTGELSPGNYYFAVSTVDANGLESALSDVVFVSIS